MNLTDYHAKYFAHELTKRCSADNVEKLAGALVTRGMKLISSVSDWSRILKESCNRKWAA